MSDGESRVGSITLKLRGDEAVHRAVVAAQAFADDHRLAGQRAARLAIIVEELVTNLVEHGGVAGGDLIELTLRRDAAGIVLVLTDPGTAFDPRLDRPTDATAPDRGGGAGIDLVKAWATILSYGSDRGRNRIELSIPIMKV